MTDHSADCKTGSESGVPIRSPAATPRGGAAAALRPEAELLLCCCRAQVDAETADRLRSLLQQELDWIDVIVTALRHGVLPLLYRSLSRVCPEGVPAGTLADLRTEFEAQTDRNEGLTRQLLQLLAELEAQGIPAVPFKGPALAALAYGDVALREFCDLDLLVRRGDVDRATALLVAQGYQLQPDADEPSRYHHHLVHPEQALVVELHWGFTRAYFSLPLDLDSMWGRLGEITLRGRLVRSLPAEEMLLALCAHGAKHGWRRLQWISDVAELVRSQPAIDWPAIEVLARRTGSARMLSLGPLLASDLLDAPLPEAVQAMIRSDPRARSLAAQIGGRLFAHVDSYPRLNEKLLSYFALRERWRDRLPHGGHYLRTLITPNAGDRSMLPLPKALTPLAYLIRPLRLAGRYGPTLLKRSLRIGAPVR